MRKALLVLGILILFGAATAQAGFNFGVKALSLKQTDLTPMMFTGSVPYLPSNEILGCYFGVDAGERVVILGGLDLTRASFEYKESGADVSIDNKASITQFIPNVGVKFYLQPRTSGNITPYLYGGIFKAFTSVDLNAVSESERADEEISKEVNSPFGIIPAFGVEYYASDNFSVGGEVGWRFSFAKGNFDWADGVKEELSYSTITTYVGFVLNYRFGGK